MNLHPLAQSFVLHFGEMGSRWGINRTVGQIYALLYISPRPLNADEIAESLGFSRSNVSMGMKELDAWHLVRLQHIPGDRRDYFTTPEDVWTIFRTLAQQRFRRELLPTLTMLRDALLDVPANEEERYAQQRLREMHDLVELFSNWFEQMQGLEADSLRQLMELGNKVQKLLQIKDKLTLFAGGKKNSPSPAD